MFFFLVFDFVYDGCMMALRIDRINRNITQSTRNLRLCDLIEDMHEPFAVPNLENTRHFNFKFLSGYYWKTTLTCSALAKNKLYINTELEKKKK